MPVLARVIEWNDSSGDILALRMPKGDDATIPWGSQLVVQGGQVAVFFRDGKPMTAFHAGRHVLTTQNFPGLTKLLTGFVYGRGNTPFKAAVYFVATQVFGDLKWGTPNPINFADPLFMNIPVRANGSFSIQVADPAVFLQKIVGTRPSFHVRDIQEHLRSSIVTAVQDTLGELNKAFQEIHRYSREIVLGVKALLSDEFQSRGLQLQGLTINPLTTTDDIQAAINRMSAEAASAAAGARKIEMELGAKARGAAAMASSGGAAAYQQFKMADAMVEMSGRPGGSPGGGPVDTGVNLGLAMIMPQMMQGMLSQAAAGQTPGGPARAESQPHQDPVAKLKQLKELVDAGILTPEEFAAKKAELMKLI